MCERCREREKQMVWCQILWCSIFSDKSCHQSHTGHQSLDIFKPHFRNRSAKENSKECAFVKGRIWIDSRWRYFLRKYPVPCISSDAERGYCIIKRCGEHDENMVLLFLVYSFVLTVNTDLIFCPIFNSFLVFSLYGYLVIILQSNINFALSWS